MFKRGLVDFYGEHKSILKWFLLVTYAFLLCNLPTLLSIISRVGVLLTPFIYGFSIAYLLNPLVTLIEKCLSKTNISLILKRKKGISLLLGYLIASILFCLFVLLVVPEVIISINGLIQTAPEGVKVATLKYVEFLNNNISEFTDKVYSEAETIESINKYTTNLLLSVSKLIPQIFEVTVLFTNTFVNLLLGYIISIYMLMNKDRHKGQIKKTIIAYTSDVQSTKIFEFASEVDKTFSKFLSAKILDSIIIGVLCYIGCLLIGVENSLLISVVVGVTNIIPYFGPFIGAIPTSLIVLFQSPITMLIYVLFILGLQQFDGNILGPKLLGDSLGLNALLIIFAVVIMTGILGLVGMFIGVPLFALIYMYLKKNLENRLTKQGKSINTDDYM